MTEPTNEANARMRDWERGLRESAKIVKQLAATNPHLTPAVLRENVVQALIQQIGVMCAMPKGQRPRGWKYICAEHWVLAHGRLFVHRPKPRGYKWGTIKECYSNSGRTALMGDGTPDGGPLPYVEGFCLALLPISHAWNVDAQGKLVDRTLRPARGGITITPEYFGVQFKPEFLRRWLVDRGYFGSLITDWQAGFPFLQNDKLLRAALA